MHGRNSPIICQVLRWEEDIACKSHWGRTQEMPGPELQSFGGCVDPSHPFHLVETATGLEPAKPRDGWIDRRCLVFAGL